jgi:predicted HD superfamily hydrolase involved in NAD metabolism
LWKQSINVLSELIKASLEPARWQHTVRCQECAVKLALHYGYSGEKASLAALCHDAFRDLSATQWLRLAEKWQMTVLHEEKKAPVLLHGPLAARYFELHWEIKDQEVLSAIRFHTSGHPDLEPIGKIVFLADGIEPGRMFPEREALEIIAFQNLDTACLKMLEANIRFLQSQDMICHPASYQWLKQLEKQRKNGV